MKIHPNHPRAKSLEIREKLVWGASKGITSQAGLLAHGRGEAFDYLIGEKTNKFAKQAIEVACAYLLLAKQPVLSTNGNSSALCPKEFVELARIVNAKIEVNLFHRSQKRIKTIEKHLRRFGSDVLLTSKVSKIGLIKKIKSPRAVVLRDGIKKADVVFVPLEDGDRAQVLKEQGKKILVVDLNPLSRSAQAADVTIVDNITRCMKEMIFTSKRCKKLSDNKLTAIIERYDNKKTLKQAKNKISQVLKI